MLILTALAIAAAPLAAQGDPPEKAKSSLAGWPQWRGPTHEGHAANEKLIEAFPADGPPILWVRDLGQGYSGFAIASQRAYTLTQSLYEQSVVCLDRDTGQTLWSYRCGWPYDGGGLYPGPRSTPSLADGKVYFATPQGLIGCLKAENGEPLWSLNINEKFGGRGGVRLFCVSARDDGPVILPVGGENASVVALARRRLARLEIGLAFARRHAAADQWRPALVVVLLQNLARLLRSHERRVVVGIVLSHGYDEHAAASLPRAYLLIAGPFHSGAHMLRLDEQLETGRCQPTPVWLCEEMSNDVASSVLSADTVFGFDLKDMQSRLHRPSRGEFRAVDWLTGKVRWSSKEPGHAQIIVADGKLVLFNDRGEVILARASVGAYEELGRQAIFPDEICWTPAALSEGRLIVRTQTRAACIYLGRDPLAAPVSTITAGSLASRRRFDPGSLLGGETYPHTAAWALGSVHMMCWAVGHASTLHSAGRSSAPCADPSASQTRPFGSLRVGAVARASHSSRARPAARHQSTAEYASWRCVWAAFNWP
jgi:outer membrane protein assembly factor BamB